MIEVRLSKSSINWIPFEKQRKEKSRKRWIEEIRKSMNAKNPNGGSNVKQ